MSNSTVDVAAIPRRVAAGAALLDQHWPGWWKRIDVDQLNIGDDCACVLGQLEGDYLAALTKLGEDAPHLAGFDVDAVDYTHPVAELKRLDAEYAALTAEWRRLIEARRATRYCEVCEGPILPSQPHEEQPGTGGLLQHTPCPPGP